MAKILIVYLNSFIELTSFLLLNGFCDSIEHCKLYHYHQSIVRTCHKYNKVSFLNFISRIYCVQTLMHYFKSSSKDVCLYFIYLF